MAEIPRSIIYNNEISTGRLNKGKKYTTKSRYSILINFRMADLYDSGDIGDRRRR